MAFANIHFLQFDMKTSIFGTLQLILYMFEDIFCWNTYPKILQTIFFLQNREFGEYFCNMPPKKRIKRRGSQEMERISTQVQARNPEMDELTCVPETQQSQQAAGVEEVMVGVEDPLQMSDTEQGDIALETQQESNSSSEDIADTQDTHATGGTQKGKGKKADKRGKKPLFSDENEQKLVDFLHHNEIIYNKTTRRCPRGRLHGTSFVRTTCTKVPAKSGSRASPHSSERSLT